MRMLPAFLYGSRSGPDQLGGVSFACLANLVALKVPSQHIPQSSSSLLSSHHSIPIQLRPPPLTQLLLPLLKSLALTYLQLYPFPRSQHFALQVKAPSFLRIVQVE